MLLVRRFMLLVGLVFVYFVAGALLAVFLQFLNSIGVDSNWNVSIDSDAFDFYMILKIGSVGGLVAGFGTWLVYIKGLR